MKLVIIGAGLAGHIAYGAFSSYNPVILEASKPKDSGVARHKAVLRFETPNIATYLGSDCEKVIVNKTAYHNHRFYNWCPPDLLNLYSMKVHGRLGRRSILSLGDYERYLLNGFQPNATVFYNKDVTSITGSHVICGDGTQYSYDFCISTIPIVNSALLSVGECDLNAFKAWPIQVITCDLTIKSDIHQTVYFPGPEFIPYRVTIEKNHVMAEIAGYETFENVSREKIVNNALSVFGIPQRFIENVNVYVQHNGKITCENDDYRRALILHMTEKYNIYSFGRYAIWKQVRADRLLGDIEKIRKMIAASEVGRKYHLKLGL